MRPDVADLQAFYASRHGQLARRLIVTQIRRLWPRLGGMVVAGLGYPMPFLVALDEAERVLALQLYGTGVPGWPEGEACRLTTVAEDQLPLPDGSVDRLLLVHALETSPRARRLMREVWRVLADGGRLIALVPNRRGLWCWSERTPFGHGQPFSTAQLERTMRGHLFTPIATAGALYLPPTERRLLLRFAIPLERLGVRLAPGLAGVNLIEAEKQILVPTPLAAPARASPRRVYAPVPAGAVPA
jgi:SAM-dependent methyltransferase